MQSSTVIILHWHYLLKFYARKGHQRIASGEITHLSTAKLGDNASGSVRLFICLFVCQRSPFWTVFIFLLAQSGR